MGLMSSLIVSNKHILVVFIGLVIILKIASISEANEESQVRCKLSNSSFLILQKEKWRERRNICENFLDHVSFFF